MNERVIVAGAGIWGCTIARRLAESGRKVLVLEKRAVVGGNCRCETDAETGIEIHSYGSHIFHTKNEEVWRFVRRFTDFNDYRHSVLANYRGNVYHLPFGRTLVRELLGRDVAPAELSAADRQSLFDAFIRGYTSKQWGVPPEQVDPAVIARLKVRDSYSTDYFDDPHQGIPLEGYDRLFDRMLDHPNIEIRCNAAFKLPVLDSLPPTTVYYSGPIDALFDYRHGALPWRTLRFETEKLDVADYQNSAVVNYTEAEVPYTRIHEFRHYHPECRYPDKTVIMREYSQTWRKGDEPYYPIANAESAALLAKYLHEVENLNEELVEKRSKLVVGGRLGQYRYFDMDQSIAAALEIGLVTVPEN